MTNILETSLRGVYTILDFTQKWTGQNFFTKLQDTALTQEL